MKEVVANSDWDTQASNGHDERKHSKVAPYESSLLGEYARLFLLLFVIPLVFSFLNHAINHQTGFVCLAAGVMLLATLITPSGYPFLRIAFLLGMTLNMLAYVVNPDDYLHLSAVNPSNLTVFILLVCLSAATAFEFDACFRSSSQAARFKMLMWGLLFAPVLFYILGLPILESIWDKIAQDERKLALRDPDWSLLKEAVFRGSKFGVFALFAYLGACFGSFLNVVAYCIPKGERFVSRASTCPKCNETISRFDNLPIFSYINLGAKCRSCKSLISPRYLAVELIVVGIFVSLFAYQLITGCENVPEAKINYEGILWVVLYPKWPAIWLYVFHSFFMCIVLLLALIEWDHQPAGKLFPAVVGLLFFVAAAVYLPLQPVSLFSQLPRMTFQLSPLTEQFIKLLMGAAVGGAAGRLFGLLFTARHTSTLTFTFLMAGMVLGWQAILQISVIFGVIWLVASLIPFTRTSLKSRPTAICFMTIALHHPVWGKIAEVWSF